MQRRLRLILTAALMALAAPGAASAATLRPATPCVVAGRPALSVLSQGWAPGSAVTVTVGASAVGTGSADAFGSFANLADPFTVPVPKGSRPVVHRALAAGDAAGNRAAPVRLRVVRRTVRVPGKAKPAQVIRYRGYGFPRHKRLYLHVRRGGRTKGTFRIGRPSGACGLVSRRLRYMPLRRWSTGTYDYWFSDTRRFRASKTLYGYRIDIFRRFG